MLSGKLVRVSSFRIAGPVNGWTVRLRFPNRSSPCGLGRRSGAVLSFGVFLVCQVDYLLGWRRKVFALATKRPPANSTCTVSTG